MTVADLELETVMDDMGHDAELCLCVQGTDVDMLIDRVLAVERDSRVALVISLRDSK